MNRFRKAWLALAGKLEPEAIPMDGAAFVPAYCVEDFTMLSIFVSCVTARRYYATCEQAHAAEPGRSVSAVMLLKVGGKLYSTADRLPLVETTLQPKPKRAKGRRG